MTDSLVEWRMDGHVAVLSMNDDATRNSLSPAMIDALCAALQRVDTDADVWCAVLTGKGDAFCSGGNPRRMLEPVYREASQGEIIRRYGETFHRVPAALAALGKPIVASINGHAIGAGLDLACYCDVRIAASDTRFASSFVKLGLVPGDGGAWILPRIVGQGAAARLMLTGETIDAQEALRIGLVSEVHARTDLLALSIAVAQKIAAHPPHATRMIKQLQRASDELSLASALALAAQMQAIAQKTEDHLEAVTAMIERREPVYTGDIR